MVIIKLLHDKEMLIDDEDLKLFEDCKIYSWSRRKDLDLWYAFYSGKLGRGKVHRIIMNAPKGVNVDHINGNGLDNRKCNLRLCNQTQNQANQRRMNGRKRYLGSTSSKYRGVHRVDKVFKAQIQAYKKKYALGTFQTERDAAIAYNIAALRLFKEFANLNDILD